MESSFGDSDISNLGIDAIKRKLENMESGSSSGVQQKDIVAIMPDSKTSINKKVLDGS